MRRHPKHAVVALSGRWLAAAILSAGCGRRPAEMQEERTNAGTERQTPAVVPAPGWRIAWRADLPGSAAGAPVSHPGGWAVLMEDGHTIGLDANGGMCWSWTATNEHWQAIACIGSRLIAVGTSGWVAAFRYEDGESLWMRQVEGAFQQPAVQCGVDDFVLVSREDGRLFRLVASDGRTRWVSPPTNRCDGPPSVSGERIAYGNCDAAVYVFEGATGTLLHSVDVGTESQMAGGLTWYGDRILGGTRDGSLVCVDAGDGTLRWRVTIMEGEALFTTPAADNESVYVSGPGGEVLALVPDDGRVLWRAELGGEAGNPVAADPGVWVCAGGELVLLDKRSGAELLRMSMGRKLMGPSVGAGELGVINEAGQMFAVAPVNTPPPRGKTEGD